MLRPNTARLVLGIAFALPLFAWADDQKRQIELVSSSGQGFHFDARTGRYFSDGKSSFLIKPVEDPKYLERIEVSLDEGDYRVYNGRLKFDDEGFHLIRFRATDPVLNWSPLQEFRIYVDLTAPKSFPYWHGPSFKKGGDLYVSSASVLQISAQDRVSGVAQIAWREGEGRVAGFPGQMSFKTEGEKVVRFHALDNVGNREEEHEIKFIVDSKAPVTKAEIKGMTFRNEQGLYVNSGSELVLASEDSASGVKVIEYQINGGLVTEYRHPIPMTEKKLEIRYRSQDQVGNLEAWKSMILLQDTAPPLVALEKVGPHLMSGGRIYAAPGFGFNVSAKDDETGLRDVMVSRDGKNFEKAPGGKISFTQPGEFHFFAKAIDRVGNTAEANPYTVIIDNQSPKSSIKKNEKLVEKDGVLMSALPNQIEFAAADEGGVGVDRIEISYDNKEWKPAGRAIDLTQWTQSRRTIWYRAVDRLGNREPAQSIDLVLRTEGPKVDLFVEQENLPEVPLSQIRGNRLPAAQALPVSPIVRPEPVRQEEPGKPEPRRSARERSRPDPNMGPPRPTADVGPRRDAGPVEQPQSEFIDEGVSQ